MSARLALARIGFRWRAAAALACLLLAGVSALESRAAPARGVVPVVVAARPLPAGHLLTLADLALSTAVRGVSGTLASPRVLLGRTLAGPLARGEPVTALRLLDRGLTTGLAGDVAAVPVDVATDVRGIVRAGGRVDLLAAAVATSVAGETSSGDATPRAAQRVAARVLVLAVLPPDSGSAGGCRLVLAIDRDEAMRVAGMRSARLFQVAALPP